MIPMLIAGQMLTTGGPPVGEVIYDTPGEYVFTVPAGVTEICAVAVGRGGRNNDALDSGGGGGLGYKNDVPVVPGAEILVYVDVVVPTSGGEGSALRHLVGGSPSTFIMAALAGGDANGSTHPAGGEIFTVTGGGQGGDGRRPQIGGMMMGGGGAGGYAGNGGHGGNRASDDQTFWSWQQAAFGSGAGAGAKGTIGILDGVPPAPGGGVGLFGIGSDGTAPGAPGSGGTGATFGGGQGGYDPTYGPSPPGGRGAVRIIWGPGRSFPYNAGPT